MTDGSRISRMARGLAWARWVCAAQVFVVGACGSSSVKPGGVSVTVKDVSMTVVADAVVTTDPATQSLVTDAHGQVLFANVKPGFYAVTAMHPSLGAARVAVTVESGGLASLTLLLRPGAGGRAGSGGGGNGPGGSSGVAGAGAGSSGTGGATAGGGGTGGTIVSDGGAGNPGGGADAGSDVSPSGSIVLAVPTKDTNGVGLAWAATGGPFASYRIHRRQDPGAFAVADVVNDRAATAYRDEKLTLGVAYSYQVGGVRAGGDEVLSNIQSVTAGVFIDVKSQVETMLVDPTRPYLYAVDRVNNSLHFINLTSNTVEKSIFVGSTPVDLAINAAGTKLFVANFGSTAIGVVDLATRTALTSLLVDITVGTWAGNPYRLVCTTGDTIVFTSEDQWNDLKLVNATTGAAIAHTGSIYEPDLGVSPDGTHVYVAESGSTGSTLIRFDVVGSKLMQVDQSGEAGAYGSRWVTVTRDGMYLFYAGQKYLASNLKSVLGTFSEIIYASNGDGTKVVGATKIHDGTTFAAIKPLPLSTTVMAMSADDKTLYLYDSKTSRIYLYAM